MPINVSRSAGDVLEDAQLRSALHAGLFLVYLAEEGFPYKRWDGRESPALIHERAAFSKRRSHHAVEVETDTCSGSRVSNSLDGPREIVPMLEIRDHRYRRHDSCRGRFDYPGIDARGDAEVVGIDHEPVLTHPQLPDQRSAAGEWCWRE